MNSRNTGDPATADARVPETRVIVAASSKDMNLYYLTGFLAGDPFIFVRTREKTYLVMSDLETGRARDEARCDEILSQAVYRDRCVEKGIEGPSTGDVLL